MPAFPRQVNFAPTPVYSRLPESQELDAFHAFAQHASRCRTCARPFSVHLAGRRLCDTGHVLAQHVAEYVYASAGTVYSVVDRELGNQVVQLEIPPGCEVVRDLLNAMERGLKVRRQAPIISYDPNYYIPPRPVAEPRIETIAPGRRRRDTARSPVEFEGSYRRADGVRVQVVEPRSYGRDPRIEIVEPPRGRKDKVYASRRGTEYAAYLEERRRYYEESRRLPARDYYDPTIYR